MYSNAFVYFDVTLTCVGESTKYAASVSLSLPWYNGQSRSFLTYGTGQCEVCVDGEPDAFPAFTLQFTVHATARNSAGTIYTENSAVTSQKFDMKNSPNAAFLCP